MNSKALAKWIEDFPRSINYRFTDEEWRIILRALRLLAAAEANDGGAPETDILWRGLNVMQASVLPLKEIHNRTVEDIKTLADFARRLERERNGLAERVLELEEDAESFAWCVKNARWIRHEHEAYVAIPVALSADLSCEATRRAAIDAARGSKP